MDRTETGLTEMPLEPRMTAERAFEGIAVPMPSHPSPSPDEVCFSSEEARRAFYAAGPPFGDRPGPGFLQMAQPEFNDTLMAKAELQPGMRVLVLGEFLDKVGFVEMIEAAVQPGGEVEYFEMFPLVEAHHVGRWAAYAEIAAGYAEGQFDAVLASQWHHLLEPGQEVRALSRVVRPDGKLVMFEPGPTAATFALAKQDALLEALLGLFVTFGGAREVPLDHAYAWKRDAWLAVGVEEVRAAAADCLEEVGAWEHRGMAIVDGRRSTDPKGES